MGEARRRRMAGEEPRSPIMVAPEDAPDMPGHVRVTMLDDDDHGTSAYFPADRLADLLAAFAEVRWKGRLPPEFGDNPERWARMRTAAFDAARIPGEEASGTVALGLWCALHGPEGAELRRQLSTTLGRAGRAAVLLRRDRTTRAVATIIGETIGDRDLTFAASATRRAIPTGCVIVTGPADEPRQEH